MAKYFGWVCAMVLLLAHVQGVPSVHPDYKFGFMNRTRQPRTMLNKRGYDPAAETYQGDYVGEHPNGGLQFLKYDLTVNPDVHLLNDYPIASVECSPSRFMVSYTPDATQVDLDAINELWTTGAILVGGAEWNCSATVTSTGTDHHTATGEPFYAVVQERLNLTSTASIFSVKFTNATDCFRAAKVNYTWIPEHHLRRINDSDAALQRREGEIEPLSYEVFSYNYDRNANGAKETSISVNDYLACVDCYAYMDVGFYFNYDTSFSTDILSMLEIALTGTAAANAQYEFNFRSTDQDKVKVVDAFITPESPEKTFTFSLVYIPIIISIKSQLKAEVEVTGSLEMSASTGFEASGNAKFGVKYEKPAPDVEGDWALVNELGWNWNYKPPTWNFRTEGANINAYLIPYTTITLWKLFPLIVKPKPYIGVRMDKPAGVSPFDKRSLNIISPLEGDVWTIGQQVTIRWSTSNVPANAEVSIQIGHSGWLGKYHYPVDLKTTNTGSYTWNVPSDEELTSLDEIQEGNWVELNIKGVASIWSSKFKIAPSSNNLVSQPDSNTRWRSFPQTITWNPAALGTSNVVIGLYSPGFIFDGYTEITPEGGIPNSGSWQFNPSTNNYAADSGYRVQIYSVARYATKATSAAFRMGIWVDTPSSDLMRNMPYVIRWTAGTSSGTTVSIRVTDGGTLGMFENSYDIEPQAPDTGSYTWNAVNIPAGSYYFEITDNSNTNMKGQSSIFEVTAGSGAISILGPNSGSYYLTGEITVTWSTTGIIGDFVKIDLVYDPMIGFDTVVPLTSSVSSTAYEWTGSIPGDAGYGEGWKIRITSLSDAAIVSEGPEAINTLLPTIKITYPTSTTKVAAGASLTVQWTASGFKSDSTVRLQMVEDGWFGDTPLSLSSPILANTLSASITVPTTTGTYYVKLVSDQISSVSAVTDDFEIIAATTAQISDVTPSAGTFYTGSQITVRWGSIGNAGSSVAISLRYALTGSSYKLSSWASNYEGTGNSWTGYLPYVDPGMLNGYWYFYVASNSIPSTTASGEYITLIRPTVSITGPTADSAYTAGYSMTVYWSTTGLVSSATLKLTLWSNGWFSDSQVAVIASAAASSPGYYTWNIPSGTSGSSLYVYAECNQDTSITSSSATFTISAPSGGWFRRSLPDVALTDTMVNKLDCADTVSFSTDDAVPTHPNFAAERMLGDVDVLGWKTQITRANVTQGEKNQLMYRRGQADVLGVSQISAESPKPRVLAVSTAATSSANGIVLPSCLGQDDVPFQLYYGMGIGFAVGDVVIEPVFGQTPVINGWDLGDTDLVLPRDVSCKICGGCLRIPKTFTLGGSSNVPNTAQSWVGKWSATSTLSRRGTSCGSDPCEQTCSNEYNVEVTGQDAVKATSTQPGSCTCPTYTGYTDSTTLAATDNSGNVLMATKGEAGISVNKVKSTGESCSQTYTIKLASGDVGGSTGGGTGDDSGAGGDASGSSENGGKMGGIPIPAIAGGIGGAAVLVGAAVGFIFLRRRKAVNNRALSISPVAMTAATADGRPRTQEAWPENKPGDFSV